MTKISLKYGKSEVEIEIPDRNLQQILKPNEIPPLGDGEIERALQNPIASKRLSEIVKPGDKVAIIASDITRPAPSKKMLPPLLEELNKGGVSDRDITIIFALGIHRRHTIEEQKSLVGEAIFNRIKCIDHDPENVVSIGRTKNGTRIEVFKPIFDADVVVCTGNIEFHYFAGYSGGAKAIMPGVCSKTTIQDNHSQMLHPKAAAGVLEGNPVREDMEEVGEKVGIDFILNVVLNEKKEIVKAVAGHPVLAHREGLKYVDAMYKVPIEKPADIVITSAGGFPKDINLYQAQKALDNAKNAVREGGTIILLGECGDGFGERVFERWIHEAINPEYVLQKIKTKFELGGHKLGAIALVLKKADIYIVSKLPPELAKKAFLTPFSDVQSAFESALLKHGGDASVIVMPYGGSTLPFIEGRI